MESKDNKKPWGDKREKQQELWLDLLWMKMNEYFFRFKDRISQLRYGKDEASEVSFVSISQPK